MAVSHYQKYRLPDVMHFTRRQQRLIPDRGAAIGHVGEIFGRKNRDHAGG